ncbi:MAG: biotin--[acetyl-CoA-carboxylase] ligase [Lachnospiraceae bacterium]|nr:biotin--[acetyl-CoA-carboxylase] ligase [Lachnospiraceae bacterium]
MAESLLELLTESGDFVSGQEVADRLGISRNAVWKAVQKARDEGIEIEAFPRKGYRIKSTTEAFGVKSIASMIKTKTIGQELMFYKEIDSTNEECRRRARNGNDTDSVLVVADTQTAGRGRRGRSWQSQKGTSISMSFLLHPHISPNAAPMLTIVMAMAVSKGIEEIADIPVGIKWPNDIVINGKKVVGILTEMDTEPDYVHNVIIGTGINVSETSFPEELKDKATSIYNETGKMVSRAGIVANIANRFEEYYEAFLKNTDLSGIAEDYNKKCVNVGRRVKVLDPKGDFEADAKGIDERGELIVDVNGEEKKIYAGEVSVRGIYGYV